jgi:epothilone polyketide synthase D
VTDEEAVTIPNAYLTAYYGLVRVGQMKAGDRVLIHAATGGVGLAAVRLALRAGAEVFATAGSPQKRAFLQSIGVAHVMDSRSGAFARQILDATNGAGVDIVLNSLTGDLIDKSVSALSDCGRFVEIGKTDLREADVIRRQRPGVSYTVLDLGIECRNDPGGVRSVLADLLSAVQSGELPPLPRHIFAMSAVRDAFRFMAQARHVGKIVVRHTPPPGVFAPDATYLVTGGAGGLGLTVARWMVAQGARHLTLVGRSGPSAEAQLAIASLEQAGATVTVARADVASRQQLEDVFSRIPHALPLRGIVHAAGGLDDGMVRQLTRERLERVMAPKVQGAWNLHQLSQRAALDFFVLFSSGAALFGSPGQANYAAGNAFLDALSQYRRGRHLPAISINWGAWSDVGMAARLDRRDRDRLSASGISPIDPAGGIDALREIMRRDRAQVAVLPINWSAFARQFEGRAVPSFMGEIVSTVSRPTASAAVEAGDDLLLRLMTCDPEGRMRLAQTYVAAQIESVLGLNDAGLDRTRPITTFGLDSLMAVELKNRFQADLGLVIPVVQLLQGPSVLDLAETVAAAVATASGDPIVVARNRAEQSAALLVEEGFF